MAEASCSSPLEDPPTPLDDEDTLDLDEESAAEDPPPLPDGPRLLPPIPVSISVPLVEMVESCHRAQQTTAPSCPPVPAYEQTAPLVPLPEARSGVTTEVTWSTLHPDTAPQVDASDSSAASSSSSLSAQPPSSPGSGARAQQTTTTSSSSSCGSILKRKVSLSEYRLRMRETGKAGNNGGGLSPCSNPLGETLGRQTSSPIKGSFPKGPGDDEEPWVQAEPRRERLSQRLRREFGLLDDDSDTERVHPDGESSAAAMVLGTMPFAVGYQAPHSFLGTSQITTVPYPGMSAARAPAAGTTTPPSSELLPPRSYFQS